jgi:hypothetical protein
MHTTISRDPEASPETHPGAERGERGESERARAYLDLWERNLCHLAIHGPVLRPAAGGRIRS